MLSEKNNSSFGWDEHKQLIVAKDVLTAIYAKDRATRKDA
ncbi:hypothetical protein Gotur_029370 [Gossypium turneri]